MLDEPGLGARQCYSYIFLSFGSLVSSGRERGPPGRLLAEQYTELLLAFGPLPPTLVPGGSLNSLGLPPPEFILTKAALD